MGVRQGVGKGVVGFRAMQAVGGMMAYVAKMQFCAYCGAELGVYAKPSRDQDTCGAIECERWVRDEYEARAEREEAHREPDECVWWDR